MTEGAVTADPAVSRRTRRFVALYLLVFVGGGLLGAEAWPVTGWKLYAATSGPEAVSFGVATVDGNGQATPVDFQSLPLAYRQGEALLKGFDGLGPVRRDEMCRAWGEAVRARGGDVAGARVYEVVRRQATDGGRPTVTSRRLAHECELPHG